MAVDDLVAFAAECRAHSNDVHPEGRAASQASLVGLLRVKIGPRARPPKVPLCSWFQTILPHSDPDMELASGFSSGDPKTRCVIATALTSFAPE